MKKTPLRKKAKSKSLAWWKNKLWTVFSIYIRKRDKFICFTCGRKGEGSGIHAGHFINKSIGGLGLYFHEQNVHAQCYHCNINLGGNGATYARRLEEVYGKELINELWQLKNQNLVQYRIEDYQRLINEYQEKVKGLN